MAVHEEIRINAESALIFSKGWDLEVRIDTKIEWLLSALTDRQRGELLDLIGLVEVCSHFGIENPEDE